MAEEHFSTLRAIFGPWYVKVISGAFTVLAAYDALSNQFPALPKLQKVVGMSGALLPWWGWLLVLQAVFVFALFDYVRRRFPAVEAGPPDTSTPQLRIELKDHIAGVQKRVRTDLEAEIERVEQSVRNDMAVLNTLALGQIKEMGETNNAKMEETLKEIHRRLKNNEDARLSQILRIGEDVKICVDRFNAINLDLIHLLRFAIHQATIAQLRDLLRSAPKNSTPLTSDPHQPTRKERRDKMENFLRILSNNFFGDRAIKFQMAMQYGESVAKRQLEQLADDEWPKNINHVESQECTILDHQLSGAIEFLERQLQEVESEIPKARGDLIERKCERDPPPKR